MSAEALTPASTSVAAICSPNRNASGMVSRSRVAAALTTRSRICTTRTSESKALARRATTGTVSSASSGPPTATRILENIRSPSIALGTPRGDSLRSAAQMAGRVQYYRAELKKRRGEWEVYLKANSGLPGPRANLELVEAVGDEADADLLWRLSASSDDFLALCGTAGLGRLATTDSEAVLAWLKELAEDPRWRVREGVAIALQRMGREDMPQLIASME